MPLVGPRWLLAIGQTLTNGRVSTSGLRSSERRWRRSSGGGRKSGCAEAQVVAMTMMMKTANAISPIVISIRLRR